MRRPQARRDEALTRLPKDIERKLLERAGLKKPPKPKRADGLDTQLEADFLAWMRLHLGSSDFAWAQSVRWRLAAGAWYKPDFTIRNSAWAPGVDAMVRRDAVLVSYDTKGHIRYRDKIRIRFAAEQFRQVRFVIVTRPLRVWEFQEVIP